MNFFELYDLPVQFNMDPSALKRKFIAMSKQSHPDLHTLSSEANQLEMLEKSTNNNTAYNTLKDDQKRTKYILQLHNKIEDEEQYNMPATFLMEMMDVNEAIMELQMDVDPDRHQRIIQSIQSIQAALQQDVQVWKDRFDQGENIEEALDHIKADYFKMKYIQRLKENVNKL